MIDRFIWWVLCLAALLLSALRGPRESDQQPSKREPDENGSAGAGA